MRTGTQKAGCRRRRTAPGGSLRGPALSSPPFCSSSLCSPSGRAPPPEAWETLPSPPRPRRASPPGRPGPGHIVKLLQPDGTVDELTMADYLFGVVAAEMPAAFEEGSPKGPGLRRPHLYRGPAGVCPRRPSPGRYMYRQQLLSGLCGAAGGGDPMGISAGTYSAKISQAVTGTDGLGILYQGAPIQAVFFSSAPGQTADAVEVVGQPGGLSEKRLQSGGRRVPNYRSQVVLTAEEVRSRVLAAYPG